MDILAGLVFHFARRREMTQQRARLVVQVFAGALCADVVLVSATATRVGNHAEVIGGSDDACQQFSSGVVEGLNKLPGVSCAIPKGAFYAFPNVKRTGWKAKTLASSLLEDAGVAIIGGPDFGILGEGYVRLSYANSTENILKALSRMGEFLSNRKAA
jgi:aspartate/methionine/tyrosine aminotransferase